MDNNFDRDNLLELYFFETEEQLAQLESIALYIENSNNIEDQINEIFRLVHSIKGSSAVMNFRSIVSLSHSLEDAFYYIRAEHPPQLNYPLLTDIILKSTDFIKNEILLIQSGGQPENDNSQIINDISKFLALSGYEEASESEADVKTSSLDCINPPSSLVNHPNYKALIFFEDGCEMENIRAYNIIHSLEKTADVVCYFPGDILDNPNTAEIIKKNGFEVQFYSELAFNDIKSLLSNILFMKEIQLEIISPNNDKNRTVQNNYPHPEEEHTRQTMISVNISKLDKLMDLAGELVISQAMVLQNPELEGLVLNSFHKASRQLIKITNDMQDAIMSIRMVSLAATFQRMQRMIRDMSKNLGKEIKLEVIGENTEVDKNIIEHLSDPLIHIVRNAVDHGIELSEERIKRGKNPVGTIALEARNEGGDVWINIKDDGIGLDKEKILNKALQQKLIDVPDRELTDREIYSFIFLPGFSTKEQITEYSGRGVGMDIVNKNIKEIGGTVLVDSSFGKGTTISIKIPLTLAIIDGMKVRAGSSIYIIPITSIRECFQVRDANVISNGDKDSNMILLRGECYPLMTLHELYKIPFNSNQFSEGIIVVVQNEYKTICLFVDELLGEQQIVVKALPECIKKSKGISGCTVMGDGTVSLIIDISGIINDI